MNKISGGRSNKFSQSNPYTSIKREKIDIDQANINEHRKLKYLNYEIYFPFKPYQTQLDYIEKVIQAIKDGKDALLQSPTGTGKTLSLLCSALACLAKIRQQQPESNAKIYFCSRTHSQITQVIKQLKKTVYKPKTVILGSRNKMCVNQRVNHDNKNNADDLKMACKKQRKNQMCEHYKNTGMEENPKGIPFKIQDIEQLASMGQKQVICPYFLSKNRLVSGDVIFMPYNYIINPNIRKIYQLDLSNSIIIIDQGHNIQSVAEESMSFILDNQSLKTCIKEAKQLQKAFQEDKIKYYYPGQSEISQTDVVRTKETLTCMLNYLKQYNIKERRSDLDYKSNTYGCSIPGYQIYKIIQDGTAFNGSKHQKYPNDGINVQNYLTFYQSADRCLSKLYQNKFGFKPQMEKWCKALSLIFIQINPPPASDYQQFVKNSRFYQPTNYQYSQPKLRIEKIPPRKWEASKCYIYIHQSNKQNTKDSKVLAFNCLDPGLGFQKLRNFKPISIILTSGTLTPLEATASELKNQFPVRIECEHVIQNNQVQIQVMKEGIQGQTFTFNYQNRSNQQMIKDLGASIAMCVQATPGGVLIFFSSYQVMNRMHRLWKTLGYIQEIEQQKKVFLEPKNSSAAKQVMKQYYKQIRDQGGAVIFSVCRGKISQGLDFSDNLGRLVIMVGIPYAYIYDYKTEIKKKYLDDQRQHKLTGQKWYDQHAMRAVNQAIGRVIRHANDYGSIILIDSRYDFPHIKKGISNWLYEKIKTPRFFEQVYGNLVSFFKQKKGSRLQKLAIQNQKKRDEEIWSIDIDQDSQNNQSNRDAVRYRNSSPLQDLDNNQRESGRRNDTNQRIIVEYQQQKKLPNFASSHYQSQTSFECNPRNFDHRAQPKQKIQNRRQNTSRNQGKYSDFPKREEQQHQYKNTNNRREQRYTSTSSYLTPYAPQSIRAKENERLSTFTRRNSSRQEERFEVSLNISSGVYDRNNKHEFAQRSDQSSQSDYLQCPRCHKISENGTVFLISKCLHTHCQRCWNQFLRRKSQCPICGKRVRRDQLKQIMNQ